LTFKLPKNLEAYKVAAINPTISPMTPPPRANTITFLVHLLSNRQEILDLGLALSALRSFSERNHNHGAEKPGLGARYLWILWSCLETFLGCLEMQFGNVVISNEDVVDDGRVLMTVLAM